MKIVVNVLAFACVCFAWQEAAIAQDTKPTQDAKPLTAAESNPMKMGWMQGFPPPSEKSIRFTDPDYFAFPKLRWTACHFRQLMPSVAVQNGSDGANALPLALDTELDRVTFTPLGSNQQMTWNEAFDTARLSSRGRLFVVQTQLMKRS